MNFISYPVFLVIQTLSALALIASALLTNLESNAMIALISAGIIQIMVALLSKEKKYLDFASFLDVRITTMIFFVLAIVLTFSPYLLSFVDNNTSVIVTTGISAITLLSFVFTNLTLQNEDITE